MKNKKVLITRIGGLTGSDFVKQYIFEKYFRKYHFEIEKNIKIKDFDFLVTIHTFDLDIIKYIENELMRFNFKIQQIKKLCLSCNTKLKDKFLKTIEYYQ